MHKHVAALVRGDGLSHEEFRDRWQEAFAAATREESAIIRSHAVVPTDPANAEFDALAETYFESFDALADTLGSDAGEDPASAPGVEADLIDREASVAFVGEEVLRKDETGGETDGLYKHSAFLVRKDGMDHGEFRDYWETQHTPLARDIEGVVRYHTVYTADPGTAAFDGVAELYFETLEALHDALGSPGSRDYDPTKEIAAKAREDVDNFLAVERRPRLIGREEVQKDETAREGY